MPLLKFLVFFTLFSFLLAEDASEFKKKQIDAFHAYKKNIHASFQSYKKTLRDEYNAYKKEIALYWDKPELSTKKRWTAYTHDKKTRTDVDFEKNRIRIQTIAESSKEAKEKLRAALTRVVVIDTKKAHEEDPLEQRLAKIAKPPFVATDKINPQPILSTVIFDKEPSKKRLLSYVEKNSKDKNIHAVESKKVKGAKVYSLNITLPSDTMLKRSRIYQKEVKKQSARQNIPAALIFAIIHSESSFNPRARSHIPAYGLMQIVPETAGIDSYLFLYDEKKLVSGSYLYNSTNNITMGSAYLHILYYKYLSKIKDPQSRLYCTIAAYNTGAGNIAWAFTKTNDMRKAAPIINTMHPREVYEALLKSLRYDEPKRYLQKVSKRMLSYHKIYG